MLTRCLAKAEDKRERARALKVRGWAYHSLRQDLAAVADQEAALGIDSHFEYRDYINLALYLRSVGRNEDSLRAIRAARKTGEANDPPMMTQYHLGWTLSELGRYEEAVVAFSLGIRDQPDYPFVYWRRGLAYEALNQRELARADFETFAKTFSASEADQRAASDMLPEVRAKMKQYRLDEKYPL